MAMNKPALDKLLDKADSKYALIIMGAKRARQITEEAPELLEGGTVNPVSIALREISDGTVRCVQLTPEQQATADEAEAAESCGNLAISCESILADVQADQASKEAAREEGER